MPELKTEDDNLAVFRLVPPDEGIKRLLRDQEEERLVDEFLNGRELQQGCAKACRDNPTGNWCLVVCQGHGRRLAGDNTAVAGVDTSTTTPTLRAHHTNSNKKATVETSVRAVQEEYVDTLSEAPEYTDIVMPKTANKNDENCLEFPMQIPKLIERLVENNPKLQNCNLAPECLILRKCLDEGTV
jgi:hypothetical protein